MFHQSAEKRGGRQKKNGHPKDVVSDSAVLRRRISLLNLHAAVKDFSKPLWGSNGSRFVRISPRVPARRLNECVQKVSPRPQWNRYTVRGNVKTQPRPRRVASLKIRTCPQMTAMSRWPFKKIWVPERLFLSIKSCSLKLSSNEVSLDSWTHACLKQQKNLQDNSLFRCYMIRLALPV